MSSSSLPFETFPTPFVANTSAVISPPNPNSLYRYPLPPPLPPSSSSSSSSSLPSSYSSASSSRPSRLPSPSAPLTVATSRPLPPPTFDPDFFDSLPPGYRFNPTDEELVIHYLMPHLASRPLPPNRILMVDIYSYHPARLAEEYKDCGENELYFFTPRMKKYPHGLRPKRSTDTGYWKATGADRPVKSRRRGSRIGSRVSLVFYQGEAQKGKKTDWLMQEFTLKTDSTNTKFDDYALCKIYRKANSSQSITEGDGGGFTTLIDQNNDEETHYLVSGIGGMETEQAGSVANAGHGSADVEQHRQYQQTSSHHLSHGDQLMGDRSPTQIYKPMSAYLTPHLVSSNRTLNTEQNGMITTDRSYGSANIEEQGEYHSATDDHQPVSVYSTHQVTCGIRSMKMEQNGQGQSQPAGFDLSSWNDQDVYPALGDIEFDPLQLFDFNSFCGNRLDN